MVSGQYPRFCYCGQGQWFEVRETDRTALIIVVYRYYVLNLVPILAPVLSSRSKFSTDYNNKSKMVLNLALVLNLGLVPKRTLL